MVVPGSLCALYLRLICDRVYVQNTQNCKLSRVKSKKKKQYNWKKKIDTSRLFYESSSETTVHLFSVLYPHFSLVLTLFKCAFFHNLFFPDRYFLRCLYCVCFILSVVPKLTCILLLLLLLFVLLGYPLTHCLLIKCCEPGYVTRLCSTPIKLPFQSSV